MPTPVNVCRKCGEVQDYPITSNPDGLCGDCATETEKYRGYELRPRWKKGVFVGWNVLEEGPYKIFPTVGAARSAVDQRLARLLNREPVRTLSFRVDPKTNEAWSHQVDFNSRLELYAINEKTGFVAIKAHAGKHFGGLYQPRQGHRGSLKIYKIVSYSGEELVVEHDGVYEGVLELPLRKEKP